MTAALESPAPTVRYMDTENLYSRALKAEPKLPPIETLVETLCATAPSKRSGKPMCSACVWSGIVKPLVIRLVGHNRAWPLTLREKDDYQTGLVFTRASDIKLHGAPSAETEIEKWLRTSEAWDAVVRTWLARLVRHEVACDEWRSSKGDRLMSVT